MCVPEDWLPDLLEKGQQLGERFEEMIQRALEFAAELWDLSGMDMASDLEDPDGGT